MSEPIPTIREFDPDTQVMFGMILHQLAHELTNARTAGGSKFFGKINLEIFIQGGKYHHHEIGRKISHHKSLLEGKT